MKKAISIILVLTLLIVCILGMAGCSKKKSEAVINTENAITAIGEVTINSGTLIETAELLLAGLNEKEKEQVSNQNLLTVARQTYDKLIEEQRKLEEQKKIEEEQKHQALLDTKNSLLSKLAVAEDKLSFVSKYAGNVNNKGQRKVASEFLDELEHCLDNVDVSVLEEEVPGIIDKVATIKSGILSVHNMLVDMGNTNSAENVEKIKSDAVEINKLVVELMSGSLAYIK